MGMTSQVDVSAAATNRCVPMETLVAARRKTKALQSTHDRMRAELEAAGNLQRALLPDQSPLMKGARFAWQVEPSTELAGDSLGVLRLDEDHLALFTIDVSGHGLPAAMLAVTVHKFLGPSSSPASILFRTADVFLAPAEVLRRLNALFPMDPGLRQYFTMIYGILDLKEKSFHFASAGHSPPIVLGSDGVPEEIAANGLPIGFLPESEYDEQTLHLEPGSRVLFYSDGLTDAADEDHRPFGSARLMQAFARAGRRPVQDAVTSVLEEVRRWSAPGDVPDDRSLLIVELDQD